MGNMFSQPVLGLQQYTGVSILWHNHHHTMYINYLFTYLKYLHLHYVFS